MYNTRLCLQVYCSWLEERLCQLGADCPEPREQRGVSFQEKEPRDIEDTSFSSRRGRASCALKKTVSIGHHGLVSVALPPPKLYSHTYLRVNNWVFSGLRVVGDDVLWTHTFLFQESFDECVLGSVQRVW